MSGGRLRSLDVFRGATVALMILVNNPGSWSAIYPPLEHAAWHGCTATDLVFPFFLFAVGQALALVMPKLRAAGPSVFWPRVLRRTAIIFALGLLLNAAPFVAWQPDGSLALRDWHLLRVMGVLQRIALCFGAASAVCWALGARAERTMPWVAAGLLLVYWAACLGLGASGDPYSLDGWFGTAVDKALLGSGHLYRGEGVPFDPEGLASTLPAIAQVLLGAWAGASMSGRRVDAALIARLFLWATALLLLAWAWELVLPFNKKIWTPSYVLHTTGLALMALAACLHLVEIRGRPAELRGWVRFCEVFGRNALFIFVLSGLVPRVLALLRFPAPAAADGAPTWETPLGWLQRHAVALTPADPRLGSLLYAVALLCAYAAIAAALDRRGIYVKV